MKKLYPLFFVILIIMALFPFNVGAQTNFQIKGITADKIDPCISTSLTINAEIERTPSDLKLEFQWYFGNKQLLPGDTLYTGTTTSILSIKKVDLKSVGKYSLIVHDPATGDSDTAIYELSYITDIPIFNFQGNINIFPLCQGAPLVVHLVLERDGTYDYSIMGHAAKGTFTTTDRKATITVDNPNRDMSPLILVNKCGLSNFAYFSLYFYPLPAFLQQLPPQVNIQATSLLELTVKINSSTPVTYQWFKNGEPIGQNLETYTVPEATADDAGIYYVRAKNDCNELWSDTTIVIIEPTGIENYAGVPGLQLHEISPHPVSTVASFSYSVPVATNVILIIRDIFGRTIQTTGLSTVDAGKHITTINAANIPPGMYYYTLQTESASITRRMIIAR